MKSGHGLASQCVDGIGDTENMCTASSTVTRGRVLHILLRVELRDTNARKTGSHHQLVGQAHAAACFAALAAGYRPGLRSHLPRERRARSGI